MAQVSKTLSVFFIPHFLYRIVIKPQTVVRELQYGKYSSVKVLLIHLKKKKNTKENKRLTNAYTCILYSNSTHNTHTAPVECLLKPIFPPSLESNLPTQTKTICPCYGVTK